jgi:hypothetical protein
MDMARSVIGRSMLRMSAPAICGPAFGESRQASIEIGVPGKHNSETSRQTRRPTTAGRTRRIPGRPFTITALDAAEPRAGHHR